MQGEVVYLYAFDVANEIVTAPIKKILSRPVQPFEIRVDRTSPKDVPLYKPLSFEPPVPAPVLFRGHEVGLLARVYDVGVVSITMRVPFTVGSLLELVSYHTPVLDDGRKIDQVAGELAAVISRDISAHLVRSSPPTTEPEPYTAFCFTDLDSATDVSRWLQDQRRNVAGLLTETEPARLSDAQVGEVLRLQRSFETNDTVVIDWDAALVVDLSGYFEDVLYMLELANLQLEEFRVMDQTLDRYLDRAYDDLEKRHLTLFGLSTGIVESLRRFRMDLTRLADEVTHITKFFGDWHLARVYLAARERFYLEQWSASVERRLGQLDQLYGVVLSEIHDQRTLWLEVIVVVLIMVELLTIFLWQH